MQQELKRAKRQETVFEKADCLRVLTKDHETLGQAIKHAEALFKQEGPIQLLSGHKSKGLEWETVFHLDPWRIPSRFAKGEDLEQEMNVRYVIETRFKKELFLVDLETFDG
jgi:superfamily I DNA/RNA helicase